MLFWDIETDGLLPDVSRVHCIAVWDSINDFQLFGPSQIGEALALLDSAELIAGHNVIGFDIPVLKKLYEWTPKARVHDTLVMSRLLYSNLKHEECLRCKPGVTPGSHSLENWGLRLGCAKGDYGKGDGDVWAEYTEEMGEYCGQDVVVTGTLYAHLMAQKPTAKSMELEHAFARIVSRQVQYGFPFHTSQAEELYADLCVKRSECGATLTGMFKGWYKKGKEFVPKKDNKRFHYKAGAPMTKTAWVDFKPTSRDHIARVLMKMGWKPKKFTDGGKPQVDESSVGRLKYPCIPHIMEYLTLDKRISQLAEGKQAWLKCVRGGRIHGSVNTNGAVTGRCTHSRPNVAQVPAESAYRALFHAGDGRVLVGCDASGLELRCLAHFMGDEDYTNEILSGDIHTKNQLAAGLATRDNAKTFIYGFLYGAGDAKIGSIVGKGRAAGKELKERFLKGTPALAKLVKQVKHAAQRGYLVGLDGRKLPIRSDHAALNTLLQSAGALVMKQGLYNLDHALGILELKYGEDYEFVANVHDEWQISCKRGCAELVGMTAAECITIAGEMFGFRCSLAGEYKIGEAWSETH